MQKFTKKFSTVIIALFTVFTVLSYMPAKAAVVTPKVQYVQTPQLEYIAGDRVQFNLNAPNYGGRVQYRVVLWNDETKSYRDLWTTGDRYYTNWQPYGNNVFTLGWIINEPGHYRITIYTKRAGIPNSKGALVGMNCDSFMQSEPFIVKAAFTATALEAYEKAPLTTLAQVTAAEALRTAAADSVAKVTDAALKASLDARVAAADKKVADAKEVLGYVHVESVKALTANTIKVVFDKEVSAGNMNFNVAKKDDVYAINFIEKVAVDKNVATITLIDSLSTSTNYVLSVKDVKTTDGKLAQKEAATKEFAYTAIAPAKVVFNATTITAGNDLGYKVLDAEGNDITADFSSITPTIETSDASVVAADLSTALPGDKKTAYSVVNVKFDDYNVETGNTIITVVDTQLALASLGRYTVSGGDVELSYTNPTTYVYQSDTAKKLNIEVLNQNGVNFEGEYTTTFNSLNNTIAVVNTDGLIQPLSVGTATVLVTAKSGDITVRKTVTITVKAAPKAASIKLSATSAKLVRGSGIPATVDVTILDQYGNKFVAPGSLTYEIDKEGIVSGLIKNTAALVDGEYTISLAPNAAGAGVKSTANLTITYGTLKANVSLSVVDPAAFAGYTAVLSTNKLDKNNVEASKYFEKDQQKATVKVYEKDFNGNYIKDITEETYVVGEDTLPRVTVEKADLAKTNVAIDGLEITPNIDGTVGTESVIVKIEGTKVATFAMTVVDSTPVLTTATQTNSSILVDGNTLEQALLGKLAAEPAVSGAFVGYNQYGNEIQIALADIQAIATDNTAVVKYNVTDGQVTALNAVGNGTATLTLKIAGNFYTVNVKVVNVK